MGALLVAMVASLYMMLFVQTLAIQKQALTDIQNIDRKAGDDLAP